MLPARRRRGRGAPLRPGLVQLPAAQLRAAGAPGEGRRAQPFVGHLLSPPLSTRGPDLPSAPTQPHQHPAPEQLTWGRGTRSGSPPSSISPLGRMGPVATAPHRGGRTNYSPQHLVWVALKHLPYLQPVEIRAVAGAGLVSSPSLQVGLGLSCISAAFPFRLIPGYQIVSLTEVWPGGQQIQPPWAYPVPGGAAPFCRVCHCFLCY